MKVPVCNVSSVYGAAVFWIGRRTVRKSRHATPRISTASASSHRDDRARARRCEAIAKPKRATGSICGSQQALPGAIGDGRDRPLPPDSYFMKVDDGPRVEVRPDTGTSIGKLDLAEAHQVSLFSRARSGKLP
jgi:hypothetical protein